MLSLRDASLVPPPERCGQRQGLTPPAVRLRLFGAVEGHTNDAMVSVFVRAAIWLDAATAKTQAVVFQTPFQLVRCSRLRSCDGPRAEATLSDLDETTPPKAVYHADRAPWLTWTICAIFLALYLLPVVLNRPRLGAAIVDWVTPEVHRISPHNVVALVASAFVHEPNSQGLGHPLWLRLIAAHWQIAFDVGWMWVLGRRAERAIGPVRFAVLFVLAAAVTSCAELIVQANPGTGGSGVRYAIFGFLFVTRSLFDQPRRVCNNWLAATFLIWTVIAALETITLGWDLGMGSHAIGLLLGALLGGAIYVSRRRWLHLAAAVVLTVVVMVSAFQ